MSGGTILCRGSDNGTRMGAVRRECRMEAAIVEELASSGGLDFLMLPRDIGTFFRGGACRLR